MDTGQGHLVGCDNSAPIGGAVRIEASVLTQVPFWR
jgi:hypothetical protein